MPVPQTGHLPFIAGFPFFSVTFFASLISRFVLHFTQYPFTAAIECTLPAGRGVRFIILSRGADECHRFIGERDCPRPRPQRVFGDGNLYRVGSVRVRPGDSLNFTRFERARMLGARALQISMGAPPLVALDNPDAITIAVAELRDGLLPMTVSRVRN